MYDNKDRGFRDEEDEESLGSIGTSGDEDGVEEDIDEEKW